jgi:transposase
MKRDYYKSQSWLSKRYITDGKNVNEIAKECGVSAVTITAWLTKFNLIRNVRRAMNFVHSLESFHC